MTTALLNGRYQILKTLGRGGMGVVHEVYDRVRKEVLALKTVRADRLPNVELFRHEFLLLSRFRHPNIERVYDFGKLEPENDYFFTAERVDGKNLFEATEHSDLNRCLDLAAQIARALSFMHERGLVHRDVKPANVLVPDQGPARVIDFGIAKPLDDLGEVAGTLGYLAPEALRGQPFDHRVDLYALGVTLYVILGRMPPFEGVTTTEIIGCHLQEQPRPLREINPSIPTRVEAIVMRLLQKDPGDRFQSADEVANELAMCAGQSPSLEMRKTVDGFLGSGTLVGRDAALKTMMDAMAQRARMVLRRGEVTREFGRRTGNNPVPCAFAVVAEPGLGKTRLLREFRIQCQVRGIAVYEGMPDGTRLGAWSKVLAAMAAARGGAPPEADPLPFILDTARLRACAILFDCFEEADTESRDLLARFVKMMQVAAADDPVPALVVTASRPGPGIPGDPIVLEPVDAKGATAMVKSMFGVSIPPVVAERLARETGGNPAFIEETVRWWVSTRRFRRTNRGWILGDIGREDVVPASLQEALSARLEKMQPQERDAALTLAVLGRPVGVGHLETVFGRPEADAAAIALALTASGVAVADAARTSIRSRFPDAGLRIAETTSWPGIGPAHGRVAALIEKEGHGGTAAHAFHLLKSGDALGVPACLAILEQPNVAPPDVSRLAAGLLECPLPSTIEGAVLRRWAVGELRRGQAEVARDLLARAIGREDQGGSAAGVAHGRLLLALVLMRLGRDKEAHREFDAAAPAVASGGDAKLHALAARVAGELAMADGRPEEASQRLADAVAGVQGDDAGTAEVLERYASALEASGRGEEALTAIEDAIAHCAVIGDRDLVVDCERTRGYVLRRMGRHGDAKAAFERAIEIRQRLGEHGDLEHLHADLAQLHLTCGRASQALASAERAIAASKRAADPRAEARGMFLLESACLRLGFSSRADEILTQIEGRPAAHVEGRILCRRAELALFRGRTQEARQLIDRSDLLLPKTDPERTALHVRILIAEGRTAPAQAAADSLVDWLTRGNASPDDRALARSLAGEACFSAGWLARAHERWTRAFQEASASPPRVAAALGLAKTALECGRAALGLECLAWAREAAEGMDDPQMLAEFALVECSLAAFEGRHADALAAGERALVFARQVGIPAAEARALTARIGIYETLGAFARASEDAAALPAVDHFGTRASARAALIRLSRWTKLPLPPSETRALIDTEATDFWGRLDLLSARAAADPAAAREGLALAHAAGAGGRSAWFHLILAQHDTAHASRHLRAAMARGSEEVKWRALAVQARTASKAGDNHAAAELLRKAGERVANLAPRCGAYGSHYLSHPERAQLPRPGSPEKVVGEAVE
ncbi:MAG: protein kinase [Planctomycetes bacterium]|nr:protein kinase [Planctomycetota bacterium]